MSMRYTPARKARERGTSIGYMFLRCIYCEMRAYDIHADEIHVSVKYTPIRYTSMRYILVRYTSVAGVHLIGVYLRAFQVWGFRLYLWPEFPVESTCSESPA